MRFCLYKKELLGRTAQGDGDEGSGADQSRGVEAEAVGCHAFPTPGVSPTAE